MPAAQVHLGLWVLLFAHTLTARLAQVPLDRWVLEVAGTNLFVVCAYMAIFHLLTDSAKPRPAAVSEYALLALAAVTLTATSLAGVGFDIAIVMIPLALYYFSRYAKLPDREMVGLVYLALAVNGFVAPLLFVLFKDWILLGEVELATALARLAGFKVTAEGTRLTGDSGMRLRMIGACSVFSNLSFSFLGYATVKAFFRVPMTLRDVPNMLALAVCLVMVNSVRLGLMTLSYSSYEFWHHGQGSFIIAVVQMGIIGGVCTYATVSWRRAWGA